MNWKLKKIFTNVRVIIALLFLLFAIIAINPAINSDGVAIRTVELNSSSSIAGIRSPEAGTAPRSRELIFSLNDKPVHNLEDFYHAETSLKVNQTVTIRTNKGTYVAKTKPLVQIIVLNETEKKVIQEIVQKNLSNGSIVNETVSRTIIVPKTKEVPKERVRMRETSNRLRRGGWRRRGRWSRGRAYRRRRTG